MAVALPAESEVALQPFHIGPRRTPRTKRERAKRSAMVNWSLMLDEPLAGWIVDRAVILGITPAQMARDILGLYANLVNEAEAEMKIDYGIARPTITMKERNQGYLQKIIPQGVRPSHLDSTPLGIEEIS